MQVRRDLMVMVAVLVAAVCLMPVAACGGSPAKGAERAQEPVKAPPPEVPYDHAVTDTAKILAGVPPEDATRFAALLKRPSWTAHRSEFDSNWSRVSAERFPAMRAWRDREFKTIADTCGTLFYPFGGPDFLSAYILFPNCRRYLLFGLEPVGSVPALERLADPRVDAVLGQLRESLSDVFLRDYFITKTMMNELQTPEVDGTVPLMLAFLARLDAPVVSIEFDDPIAAAAAKRAAGTAKPAPADAKPGPARPA
ncbi:MAG: hypothetical protein NTY02_07360, partial [Acidobacteria bacterium]|nr:hypothetical protein [Acidobacteriota bacterium]